MSGEPFRQALDGDWSLGVGVRAVAAAMPDKPAFTVLADGETIVARLSYAELDARACALGARLADHVAPGARVLVACNPGVDFITAFLGIAYCGAVPVPVPVPRFANQARRIEAIVADAGAAAIVTRELGPLALPASVRQFAPDGGDVVPDWVPTPAPPDSLALLQYTSGSTGAPKGVTVTHANLAANSELLRRTLGYDELSVSLTWLPPSHDMGLIEGLLQPILHGVGAIVLPSEAFLRRPIRWLQAITRFGVTHSGGPNFAYQLCVDRARAAERAALDLSSWRLAYAGAEPIRYEILDRFARAFAESGFRRSALNASYGLAEATLLVSNGPAEPVTLDAAALEAGRVVHVRAGAPGSRTMVRCGRPDPELAVSIRDPSSRQRRAANRVGEICLSGASVSRGYWAGEAEPPNAPEFWDDDGTRWLRTGRSWCSRTTTGCRSR